MNDQPGAVEVENTVTSEVGPWAMVPVWVLSVGLSGSELAVYVSLRSFADAHGRAHPRVKKIAERAGVSERTAERAIARMRELKLLTTTRRYDESGSIRGCHYVLRDLPFTDPGVTVTPPPDEVVARGTDEVVATPPTRLTEQEHTNEHTRENTPSSGVASQRTVKVAPAPVDDDEVLLAIRDELRTVTGKLYDRKWCQQVHRAIFTGQPVSDPIAYAQRCIRSDPERFTPTPLPPRVDRRAFANARRRRTSSEDVADLIGSTRQRLREQRAAS